MFASHFGMDGSPFQLSPDPRFYFDSHGHHRALAAMRRGLSEASGFTVISGEVGAGKTTVVRAVLRELKPAFFAVAQIVSTQLDAEELLRAISIGFGIPSERYGPLALAASLRRLLADLRAQRRRAVLVIDEAQNLHPDAFDQLAGLAMRGAPSGRGMQICLVGQPELQSMMDSPDLLAVREQICVSCHLGPIERAETGPYVEHRLRTVGWKGSPGFGAGAFDEIFRWTDGIPRRINTLCGRLLSACVTIGEATIAPDLVERLAREQRAEIGEQIFDPPSLPAAPLLPAKPPRRTGPPASARRSPVLCVVDGFVDHLRAAALMAAMAERVGWPSMKLVRIRDDESLMLTLPLFEGLDWTTGLIRLNRVGANGSGQSELRDRFKVVVDKTRPSAVVVFGRTEAAAACCTVARLRGVPTVRIDGGPHRESASDAGAAGRDSSRSADLWYASDEPAARELVDEGVAPTRIHCVGDLLLDSVQMALGQLHESLLCGSRHRIATPFPKEGGRYALVLIEAPEHFGDRQLAVSLIAFLRRISRSVPLVLLMRPDAERAYNRHGFDPRIVGEQMCRLPVQSYLTEVDLLRNASCAITDSPQTRQAAVALHVPCLTLSVRLEAATPAPMNARENPNHAAPPATRIVWRCSADNAEADEVPEGRQGTVGAHLAQHLFAWLESSRRKAAPLVTDGNREQVPIPARITPP